MTIAKLDFTDNSFTNPHHNAAGDTYTNIYSFNYDFLMRKLHNKETPTVFFPDIEPTNIIVFETIIDGILTTKTAFVLNVGDDSITISYSASAEEIILNQ